MKHQFLLALVLFTALFMASCGGDDGDETPQEPTLTILDFSTTIPNLSNAGFIVGQINASSTSNGGLTYELTNESVPGALSIGASNGQILVADASLIDHEQNSVITARVEVSQGDFNSSAELTVNIDELNSAQLETVDYFKDIALGFEFGNASRITRKWRGTMKVFVMGSPTTELTEELDKIIDELRALITDDFEIELVDRRGEANYEVFFGSGDEYAALYPNIADAIASNWGLFFLNWDSEQYLNIGQMYVDTERANPVEQRHLLREEFTQSLGLARDSEEYLNSIFQSAWTRTTSYTDLDKELIRLLYHPDMTSDLSGPQVDEVLRDILTNE